MTPNKTPLKDDAARSVHANKNVLDDRLLTIQEVADFTGLAVGTLYHLVSQRRIPVVRLSKRCIRFRNSDLSDWIETLAQKS
jgi:excisionase family DNA binding protein